jgi:excinuclease ABC subunit C
MSNLIKGVAAVKKHLKTMPTSSGVYKMLDQENKILYIGKAKNLAKRILSYSHPERLEYRIQTMISYIVKIEVITTKTETDALLLESNLIKKFEPKYNILLKDGKTYPYIFISEDHNFPRITKHRGARKLKGKYYGPFTSAHAVNKSISDLQKSFLLRPCSDNFFSNRTRPCMEYQIKKCSAPCTDKISKSDYAILVKQAQDFLEGKSRGIQEDLVKSMESASACYNYEKAAIYRDRIKALNQIQKKQNINIPSLTDTDIIGLYNLNGNCCIQVLFYRQGQNFGNNYFFLKNTEDKQNSQILNAFICQHYTQSNLPPTEIIASDEVDESKLIEEYFLINHGYKVSIKSPKLGEKKNILNQAVKNAKNSLEQNIIENEKQTALLQKIADLFNMSTPPKRIEIYDNSHISGQYQVGAMVVADENGFNKKHYRRFNIKDRNIKPGDDYAMLTEVLKRRFRKNDQNDFILDKTQWPDLVLIDGGAGHLTTAINVFSQLEILNQFTFVCISKGPDRNAGKEKFHMQDKESFTLDSKDPAMYYLQILRDEAHRFAIGSHRKKRATSTYKSEFDSIANIGPKRKKLLINHFGSVSDVKQATLAELKSVAGINTKIAQIIYDSFR